MPPRWRVKIHTNNWKIKICRYTRVGVNDIQYCVVTCFCPAGPSSGNLFSHKFLCVKLIMWLTKYSLLLKLLNIFCLLIVLFSLIVLFFVLFVSIVLVYVLFLCKCVLYYCHLVSTELHLSNISCNYCIAQMCLVKIYTEFFLLWWCIREILTGALCI